VKLKLDENIPASAGPRLAALGLDVDTVLAEGLQGRADDDVWAAARSEGRVLVTQDLDFADIRKFAPGTHAGLFIVRLPDSEQWRLADYLVGWVRRARCSYVARLLHCRDSEQAPYPGPASLKTRHCGRERPKPRLMPGIEGLRGPALLNPAVKIEGHAAIEARATMLRKSRRSLQWADRESNPGPTD
jgi:predicted nuclease of predicted toxin-antitoxin system